MGESGKSSPSKLEEKSIISKPEEQKSTLISAKESPLPVPQKSQSPVQFADSHKTISINEVDNSATYQPSNLNRTSIVNKSTQYTSSVDLMAGTFYYQKNAIARRRGKYHYKGNSRMSSSLNSS